VPALDVPETSVSAAKAVDVVRRVTARTAIARRQEKRFMMPGPSGGESFAGALRFNLQDWHRRERGS
jgi:hypothetical protein